MDLIYVGLKGLQSVIVHLCNIIIYCFLVKSKDPKFAL